ncbi:MAG: endonuclease MutS2 [Syntrophomonadaceae bacterium]
MIDKATLEKLEFNKILQQLANRTYSAGGRSLALALEPLDGLDEVNEALDLTGEAMEVIRYGEPAFLHLVKPVQGHLGKAGMGGILAGPDLLEVYFLVRAVRLAVKYTGSSKAVRLKEITAGLVSFPELEKTIHGAIDEEGYIRDDATPELKSIRRQIDTARQRIKDYLQNFIRSGNNQALLQDALITERSGRYVVPVKQEYRHEVKGIVHDESASGATLFIEPLPVVEQNNRIRSLQIEEKREEERILRVLSTAVAGAAGELAGDYHILCNLDLLFARAFLAYDMEAFRPIVNDRGKLDISRAKHPLLGEKAVPINVSLGERFDILVITGPNTGGKTVVLKTIGLLTVMAMCGLFIPTREKSQISIFKKIYADIGDEQSIEQSLSTFSSHLKNIIRILDQADADTLVLLDELGAGTDPVEGAALARAILGDLKEKGARVVVTTHQSELKTYAYQNDRVENACVEFDPLTLSPTYELSIGTPGQSNAFEIAARLGLNGALVGKAREFVPERDAEIGNMIRQLKESRYLYETGRRELESARQQLDRERGALETERDSFQEERESTRERARQEADQYVRRIKREADEAIDELKELIKQREQPPKWHELDQKSRKIKNLAVQMPESEVQRDETEFKPGDYVLVRSVSQTGQVMEGPNTQGEVVVQIGGIRLTVAKEQLVRQKPKEGKKAISYAQTFLEKAQNISPEIDLRGKYSEDAITELDKYLEDANLAGLDRVRVIHGKGTGALRLAVRDYLQGHRYVREFRDGMRQEGGYGVTVIELK